MRLVCFVIAAILFVAGRTARGSVSKTLGVGVHSGYNAALRSAKRDSTIPESSGVALLGTSLLGFAGVIRKRFVD